MDPFEVAPYPSLALLVTMYDEVATVARTLTNLAGETALVHIRVVQSTDGPPDEALRQTLTRTGKSYHYDILPNLAPRYDRFELPSQAICRNYSHLFSGLRRDAARWSCPPANYVIAITGDTLLENLDGIWPLIARMQEHRLALAVSKAIGQDYHRADRTADQLRAGMGGGREQTLERADFQPQLFLVDFKLVQEGGFCSIPVTNRWTSEQCLGDAAVWPKDGIPVSQLVIAQTAYPALSGVSYHVR